MSIFKTKCIFCKKIANYNNQTRMQTTSNQLFHQERRLLPKVHSIQNKQVPIQTFRKEEAF